MDSLWVFIMVSLLDIVMRGVYGFDKILMEHFIRIICMVLIWVISFALEQEYDHLSPFLSRMGPCFHRTLYW